jgi:pimeloyl-ACP methyl ester carboxylesterase
VRSFRPILYALIAVASGATAQQPPVDESLAPYASTVDSVILPDGRKLHFTCMGEGLPTVILTAGLADWGTTWNKVQPTIAKTTRVCTWDRPGFGLSDNSPARQTVATTAADLEAALAKGTIRGPYVMVGHSLGSYESLLFADRHRDEVAGMVLVDPSIPDQSARFARVSPAVAQQFDGTVQQGVAVMRQCAADLRDGTVAAGKPDPNGCLRPLPTTFPQALRDAIAPLRGSARFETQASINATSDESATLVVNPARRYGDIPLIVLTATVAGPPPPDAPADFAPQLALVLAELNRGHDELAALSTRGVNARVPGATHAIQQVKPLVVIDAVEAVVAEARAAARSST